MGNLRVLVLLFLVSIGVFGLGDESPIKIDPEPDRNVTSTETPTTSSPVTTTLSPNTTVPPPAPNTTTPYPKTTTTTTAPNTTTTAATTTPAPPTPKPPTPKPTPTPDPTIVNWTINYDNSNKSCIIVQVALQYEIKDSKTNKTIKINVPEHVNITGSCEEVNKQNLKVMWGENNSVTFDFGKSNTSKFDLDDISTTLNISLESGPKIYNLVHNTPEFSTPIANSYKCARVQTLNLTEANSNETVAYLHVSHLQYQAFHNATGKEFSTALDCEGSVTTDVVPIVVGCVLAALVIMVLIAYLVGRRRCQARGYLSMFAETKREVDYIPMKSLSCFN